MKSAVSSRENIESFLEEITKPMVELLFAAGKPVASSVTKYRLPMVKESLWDWMRETNKAFNLGVKL
jgi:hypothetical protein